MLSALLAGSAGGAVAQEFPYRPAHPAPGWVSAAPAQRGLDTEALAGAIESLAGEQGVECVLLARQGSLVAEADLGGDGCRQPHNIQSASKSILSLLIGIAIDRGDLSGIDQYLRQVLPEAASDLGAEKGRITVEQLLTMQSGLATTSGAAYGAWVATGDWTRAALARPLEQRPGTSFTYSTGNSHLLAAVLRQAVGEDLLTWGNRVLFDPIGVSVDGWDRSPEGVRFGGNSFAITALELLRLGQLVLDDGRHGDRRLVSQAWLQESLAVRSEGWPDRYGAYGYLWWLRPDAQRPAALAVGYGGQFLYLVPSLDLGVAVTSDHRGKGAAWDLRVLDAIEEGIVATVR